MSEQSQFTEVGPNGRPVKREFTAEERQFHRMCTVFPNKEIRKRWKQLKWRRFRKWETEKEPQLMALGDTYEERQAAYAKQMEFIINEAFFINKLMAASTTAATTAPEDSA